MTEPAKQAAREALRDWETYTGKPASASEGNAFMDGWQAALSSAGVRELREALERIGAIAGEISDQSVEDFPPGWSMGELTLAVAQARAALTRVKED